jgi:hypothetical protein
MRVESDNHEQVTSQRGSRIKRVRPATERLRERPANAVEQHAADAFVILILILFVEQQFFFHAVILIAVVEQQFFIHAVTLDAFAKPVHKLIVYAIRLAVTVFACQFAIFGVTRNSVSLIRPAGFFRRPPNILSQYVNPGKFIDVD